MQTIDINLATRGRAANPVLTALVAVLFVATALYCWHTSETYLENTTRLERSSERLAEITAVLDVKRPGRADLGRVDSAALAVEVEIINALLVRESFSWSRLLTGLEHGTPSGISYVQISPEFRTRKILLVGIARSLKHALRLVDKLGASEQFTEVFLLKHSELKRKKGMVSFSISAVYVGNDEV